MPERFGTVRNSAIKQVASGRFGVTSEYLTSAQEIQIKMAQGGQARGGRTSARQSKAWPWIARTRCSTPGVSLTSPPPHHDIYSIEDLAELIYDLKKRQPVCGHLREVGEPSGGGDRGRRVAKAGAQTIRSPAGTGARGRPQKRHHAGLPWEIGCLAEAQRTPDSERPAQPR